MLRVSGRKWNIGGDGTKSGWRRYQSRIFWRLIVRSPFLIDITVFDHVFIVTTSIVVVRIASSSAITAVRVREIECRWLAECDLGSTRTKQCDSVRVSLSAQQAFSVVVHRLYSTFTDLPSAKLSPAATITDFSALGACYPEALLPRNDQCGSDLLYSWPIDL